MMQRFLRWISPLGIILGSCLALLVFGGLILGLNWSQNVSPKTPVTAVVNRIAWSSPTPTLPAPSATPVPTPATGEEIPPPPGEGDVAIGSTVQVTGTGGDGLRLRTEPGLAGVVRFLALEGEIMLVEEGPENLDGYTWWLLVAPYDPEVRGWAAANYIRLVENP